MTVSFTYSASKPLGLGLLPLSGEMSLVERGCFIETIRPGAPALSKGRRVGMTLQLLNGNSDVSMQSFDAILKELRKRPSQCSGRADAVQAGLDQ